MKKKVDLKKREMLLKSGKGFVGIVLAGIFSGTLGAFEKKEPKVIKKVVIKKEEATWG